MANTLITQLNNPVVIRQLNRRLATIASLLLIIACAYLLVEITWLFFPQEEAVTPVQQKRPLISKSAQQNNVNKLTAANVFGTSQSAAVSEPSNVPETKLNLTLKGVLAATPMKLASAIIAKGKSGNEDIYSIGDTLPGGVEIKEIHPEFVVLERNGRLETLRLPKDNGVDGLSSNNGRQSTGSFGRGAGSATPGAALKQIRENIIKNPTSFGEYALPVVVKERGKQIGYRLKPQQKGELLAELGVETGDVITEINGVKLNNQRNGINALRQLSTAKSFNIVVKRNGADVPLSITLP